MSEPLERRRSVLPRFSIASTKSPNSKLNVAFVGVGGVGGMAINGMKSENAVAFCDVDTRMSGWHKKENPKSRFFQDYREMLGQNGQGISTPFACPRPTHSHFKITARRNAVRQACVASRSLSCTIYGSAANSRRGPQVLQGPDPDDESGARYRRHTPSQRMVRHRNCGSRQGSTRNVRRSKLVERQSEIHPRISASRRKGSRSTRKKFPATLNWDMWLNQGKYADYNNIYTPLSWRGFWDYGTGMLGDWFCHTGDAPVWALDPQRRLYRRAARVRAAHSTRKCLYPIRRQSSGHSRRRTSAKP